MPLPPLPRRASLLMLIFCLIASRATAAAFPMTDMSDTRGPVVNAHMTVVATAAGVQAPGYRYVPPAPITPPWQGRWIMPRSGPGETILLRQEVTLDQMPEQVLAWVTAGTTFRLYVNGALAERGPADQGRDYDGGSSRRWFYDRRDLTHLFHKGRNVLAAQVLGEAPFLFQAAMHMPGGHTLMVTSDETWRGMRTEYLTHGGDEFDGGKEPIGWQTPGFDDSAWPACMAASGVHDALAASELPPCMEVRYPVLGIDRATPGVRVPARPFQNGRSVIVTRDGSFAVRFGRVLSAYVGIAVKGGAGARIELQPHEVNAPGASNPSSRLTLRDGVQFFESPGFASVGVINVLVTHVTTPVEILDVSADFTSQPVAYQGAFACSDDALNRLWQSCRWSTQICLQSWHLDSPQHQEPISDYGDYLIADRVSFLAFGNDPWLARQDLRKWAWVMQDRGYHTFHTSYALLWLQALIQYYDYTGDSATVKELSPFVFALMDRFAGYRGRNGLISEAPNYMFLDWVGIAGFTAHHPPAVIGQGYLTAFYVRALADAARVARVTGDHARARTYAQARRDVIAAYNRKLWDPTKGLYRDGKPFQTSVRPSQWLPADKDVQTWSAQNNALAVLYDIAPPARQQAVMEAAMAQTPWNVRPYFMHFVLGALAHAGLFERYGTEWMRKWHINPDTQTSREMGDEGDLSHGWVATPLIQMCEHVLGVRPLSPAYRTIAVRPALSDLQWAKGSVPTPHGPVRVSWRRTGSGLTLVVTVPPGTTAEVAIPAVSPGAIITANGKPFWKGGRAAKVTGVTAAHQEPKAVVARVAPGAYTFVGHILGLAAIVRPTAPAKKPFLSPLPISSRTDAGSQAAFEDDLANGSLIALGSQTCTSAVEARVAHPGGGVGADAVRNGTTRNGSGGANTQDDGKTFRGYGAGSSITFTLNTARNRAGYDLTRIATFAGHSDARAGQKYSVLISLVSSPAKFLVLVPSASVACDGGSSEIVIRHSGGVLTDGNSVKATGVAAVRFDFQDGDLGFQVYREIQIMGQATPLSRSSSAASVD